MLILSKSMKINETQIYVYGSAPLKVRAVPNINAIIKKKLNKSYHLLTADVTSQKIKVHKIHSVLSKQYFRSLVPSKISRYVCSKKNIVPSVHTNTAARSFSLSISSTIPFSMELFSEIVPAGICVLNKPIRMKID